MNPPKHRPGQSPGIIQTITMAIAAVFIVVATAFLVPLTAQALINRPSVLSTRAAAPDIGKSTAAPAIVTSFKVETISAIHRMSPIGLAASIALAFIAVGSVGSVFVAKRRRFFTTPFIAVYELLKLVVDVGKVIGYTLTSKLGIMVSRGPNLAFAYGAGAINSRQTWTDGLRGAWTNYVGTNCLITETRSAGQPHIGTFQIPGSAGGGLKDTELNRSVACDKGGSGSTWITSAGKG